MSAPFSDDLRDFIHTWMKSVWAVELLLFLCRNDKSSWSVDALTRELRSSNFLVEDILANLVQAGIVRHAPDGYRYEPAASFLDGLVRQLADAYATRPLAVSKEILAGGRSHIQTFADAFKLKRD
jgi:hypothetical protein